MKNWLILMAFLIRQYATGLYLSGRLHTNQDWKFLGRFCFLSDIGQLRYRFFYPYEECCHNILLYYDENKQWESVYKNASKNCYEKEAILLPKDHQIINLTTKYAWSGCMILNQAGKHFLECNGSRSFRTLHERWWYITVSNCEAGARGDVIDLEYELQLTNGNSFWTKHFSADEFGILEIYIAFLIVYCIIIGFSCYIAVALNNRQMFHTTYKMFISCLGFEVLGLLLLNVSLGTYAEDGVGNARFEIAGKLLGSAAELLFLLLLLLLGKGFTVTRGQLSHSGTIKLSIFFTVYAVISIALFLYEYVFSDPGLVLYVYESVAGYGLIALRMAAWFWFTYGIIFTLKHYPEKSGFYYRLYIFYSLWFFTVPVMVLVATFAIPKYMRSKIITALERCIDFFGYFVFLILTRPNAANQNFPYHVRTSQVGIVNPNGKVQMLVDFPHSIYEKDERQSEGPSVNLNELFMAQRPSALQNGSRSLTSRANSQQTTKRSEAKREKPKSENISESASSVDVSNNTKLPNSSQRPPGYNEVIAEHNSSSRVKSPVELFSSRVQTISDEKV